MPRSASFTQGEINRLLTHKTLAMLIGIMGMVAFNLTDTYFISLLGTAELAAISFTFPVVMSIMALTMGIGVGSSTVVSKALGRGDQSAVKRLTTDSLILAFFIVLVFTSLGLYFMVPTFQIMGAGEDLQPIIFDYMTIWFYGMPFLVIPMVGNNAIRAKGEMKKASMIMIVAMLINLVLDPILIFGLGPIPRMEVQGAALATLIARAVTLFLSLYVLTFQEDMITWTRPKISQLLASFKQILFIALPMGATNLILPLGMGVITKLVASYGVSAVAAYGVASRIEMFAFAMTMALSSVLGPFFGQNWGAKLFSRLDEGLKKAFIFAFFWGTFIALIFWAFNGVLANLFSSDDKVVEVIILYLTLVPIGYGLHGVLALSTGPLNVLEKPLLASFLTLTHVFVLFIPLAYYGSSTYQLRGIFAAAAISKIVSGTLAFFVVWKVYTFEKTKYNLQIAGQI